MPSVWFPRSIRSWQIQGLWRGLGPTWIRQRCRYISNSVPIALFSSELTHGARSDESDAAPEVVGSG